MSTIDSAAAVKAAYEYLMKASPNASKFSNFRLEEIQEDKSVIGNRNGESPFRNRDECDQRCYTNSATGEKENI